ncbi:DNA-binding domain-containing protein [Lewinella cohaerens]|uniref:HvfC/BufC N-terminal domain-containing protein n=1 Tax=Lewinella cohaerens TaxID=70995 RepID=UPI0003A8D49F|nr:DNA-binding domain-containing protein [Lewinella cohaerens]
MANSKLSLADFQKWMLQMLLQPGYAAAKIGEGRSVSIEEVFKPSSRLPARQHLAIYQQGYTARLRDCLAKQFTALEYALSPDLFQAFADEYLRKYPSESYSLANLGDRFMTYLEESRPDRDELIKEDWPDFMIELARFEWLINHLFNADVEHEDPMATMTTPLERLSLVPGIRLLATKFPVRWFYQAVAKGEQPHLPEAQPSYCAILRRDYKLTFFDLHPEQYLLLQALADGQGVPQALRWLSEKYGYDAKGLAEIWPVWYAQWQRAGFFSGSGSVGTTDAEQV